MRESQNIKQISRVLLLPTEIERRKKIKKKINIELSKIHLNESACEQ